MGSLNNDLHKPLFLSVEYLQNFYLKKHMWKPSQKTPPELLFCFFTDSKKASVGNFFTKSPCQDHLAWWVGNSSPMPVESPIQPTAGNPALTNHICWWFRNLQFEKIDQYSHNIYIYIHITSCMIIYYTLYIYTISNLERIIPYHRLTMSL